MTLSRTNRLLAVGGSILVLVVMMLATVDPQTQYFVDEVMEKVKKEGGDYALFAVTDDGYKKLSTNFADIRNKLYEQNQIIMSYREYYEGGDE